MFIRPGSTLPEDNEEFVLDAFIKRASVDQLKDAKNLVGCRLQNLRIRKHNAEVEQRNLEIEQANLGKWKDEDQEELEELGTESDLRNLSDWKMDFFILTVNHDETSLEILQKHLTKAILEKWGEEIKENTDQAIIQDMNEQKQ